MRLSGTKTNSIHQYRGLGDQLWDISGTRPSLDLRFADSKSLVDATTGQNLVTFTRASSGTFVGSNGVLQTATNDVPRFDHNPTTGESLGLLVEEQRTNLLARSEEFEDASWSKNSLSVIANAAAAPNGSTTADKLIKNNGVTANSYLSRTANTSGSPGTLSIYAKAGEYTRIALYANTTSGDKAAIFDLSAGTVVSNTGTSATIESLSNAWYRCSFTSNTNNAVLIGFIGTGEGTGDGNSGVFIWGAQLEAGSFTTSYIPTTTATATRSADVASITGTNFSSWYRQDEGTVFAETQLPASTAVNTSSRSIVDATDGSTNNRVNLRAIASATSTDQLTIQSGAVTVAQFASAGTNVSTTARKIAAVYKLNDYASWATGATSAATDTSGAIPVGVNQITVGSAVGGSEFMTGTIRRLTYWPARLPNSTLQDITR